MALSSKAVARILERSGSCARMMRPLLALAILMSLVGPTLAQSTRVLRQPNGGYIVIPPSGPAGQVIPAPDGSFMIVAPPGPPRLGRSGFFAVTPENDGAFDGVPSDGDQPEDEALPCCSPP